MSAPEPRLILGDCLDELRVLDAASVDAIVTDPPYGLSFMGKHWDRFDIEQRVGKRDVSQLGVRLTGGADSLNRKETTRTASAFANAAGAAGGYDFTLRGNRAFQQWCEQWGHECLRILKPGGHLLVFGGTRTYHRLACGLEDSGFEIRDEILAWMFGSGFPKSLNVAKAIDSGGGRPEDIRRAAMGNDYEPSGRGRVNYDHGSGSVMDRGADDFPELSPDAEPWDGWGTALKPAHEPIVVARKPLGATVAVNVLTNGTGALNIDGCRVAVGDEEIHAPQSDPGKRAGVVGTDLGITQADRVEFQKAQRESAGRTQALGRWPANVVLVHADTCRQVGTTILQGDQRATGNGSRPSGFADVGAESGDDEPNAPVYGNEPVELWECVEGCPVRMLDEQSGITRSAGGANGGKLGARVYGTFANEILGANAGGLGDVGGASRFFYCAKVSRAERNAGLEGFNELPSLKLDPTSAMAKDGRRGSGVARNNHPTVKPIALMRWLVRLVTPPGGLVLDPFLGSGTTGIAANLEGFRFIGIEREADYMKIAEARMKFWAEHGEDGLRICAERDTGANERRAREDAGQLNLLA